MSILLVVYTLGKVVGARGRAAALAASRAWAGKLDTCRLLDEKGHATRARWPRCGRATWSRCTPARLIAVDGVIREGIGFVAEAAVSGEPFAVVRRPGDRVLAGAASHDATFRVEATAAGTDAAGGPAARRGRGGA